MRVSRGPISSSVASQRLARPVPRSDTAAGKKYPHSRPWTVPQVAVDLGEAPAVRVIMAGLRSQSPGYRAMVAVLDMDFAEAAELYAEAQILLFEAEARLRAAEQLLAAGVDRLRGRFSSSAPSPSTARSARHSSSSVASACLRRARDDG